MLAFFVCVLYFSGNTWYKPKKSLDNALLCKTMVDSTIYPTFTDFEKS